MAFRTINPKNNELVKEYKFLSKDELDQKINTAHKAYLTHKATSLEERKEKITKVGAMFAERAQQLAETMALEMGKPVSQGVGEGVGSKGLCDYYAGNIEKLLGHEDLPNHEGNKKIYLQYAPTGVVYVIIPWNYPTILCSMIAVPILLAGNTVIMKFAPNNPQLAEECEKVFVDAGLTNGEFQQIRVDTDVTEYIISHKYISGVSFTGSCNGGKAVAQIAGKHLKKCVLELGGSDPFIVLEDADIANAVESGAKGRLNNAGQTCIAPKRFLIREEVYDTFKEKMIEEIKKWPVGDPKDKDTVLGPVARTDLLENLKRQCNQAIKDGATVGYGDKEQLQQTPKEKGNYFSPMILENIDTKNCAYSEEFFGPAFLFFKVQNDQQAIDIANDSDYGLSGAIMSKNLDRAEKMAQQIDTGSVCVNKCFAPGPTTPFGGTKNSGIGREGGVEGAREFCNFKPITIKE